MTKGERTKQRMVESVIESVARYGFEFTTATTISKLAKINRGLIVHYFETIEKLIKAGTQAVGTHVIQRTNELMLEYANSVTDPIERYVRATFDIFKERPHYAQFFVSLILRASYDKKGQEPVMYVFQSGRERIKKMIEEGNKSGLYKCKNPTETAMMLHTALIGNLLVLVLDASKVEALFKNTIATAEQVLEQ